MIPEPLMAKVFIILKDAASRGAQGSQRWDLEPWFPLSDGQPRDLCLLLVPL